MDIKPGQLVSSIGWQTLELVFDHPAHIRNFQVIRSMINKLRKLDTAEDSYNFQKLLFQEVYKADVRRGECTRALKRIKVGKKPDTTEPSKNIADNELDRWRLEEFVYERIGRQLRSIGDAFAWQSFGYDRRLILTLSRNSPAGSMNLKTGLDYELGRIEDIWSKSKHFALLHDLTNCLRMGDITEFTSDGGLLFHEIKTNPNNTNSAQIKRIKQAIEAIINEGKLPGHDIDAKLIELKTEYVTDIIKLGDLIKLAHKYGFRGMKLDQGRAVIAYSLPDTFELYKSNPKLASEKFANTRVRALKRAGIANHAHHVNGNSFDTASRSPIIAPWAIYPFSADDCASLTCDLIRFETVISIDSLVSCIEKTGLKVDVKLPNEHSTGMPEKQEVLRAYLDDRGITVHGGGMKELLYELIRPETWAKGLYETLTKKDPPESPVTIFANESATWWK